MDSFSYIFAILFLSLIALIYAYFKYKYSYWKNKGVFGPAPKIPFGNLENVIKRKQQFFQPYCDYYFQYKHLPYIGLYSMTKPTLSVHDPDIVKHILIRDYNSFNTHGIYTLGDEDLLAHHLFNIYGKKWKTLRNRLSPAFSLARTKNIFSFVDEISNQCLAYIDSIFSKGQAINILNVFEKYSMEIASNVGFGVLNDGFQKPYTEFHTVGHAYFNPNFFRSVLRFVLFFSPELALTLKVRRVNSTSFKFFNDLVRKTVEYRESNNYRRNDYLQALIEIKNANKDQCNESERFTMDDLAANTMMYLLAGFETTSTTGQFVVYELARNPDVQTKVREEISKVLKHNETLTYEAITEMNYLHMIIDETLRIHPPMRALFRRCTETYKVPDKDLVIEKGTLVFIPIQAIQMDPEFFPEPELFRPERFSSTNKRKLHPCLWMPFGEGPRKCLGLQQGYMQLKVILIKILLKYEISLDQRTEIPINTKVTALGNASTSGIWIRLRELDSSQHVQTYRK